MFNFFKKKKLPLNAPTFLIIGAQKAGTTTLFDVLNEQEQFAGSTFKEVGFFSKDVFFSKGLDFYHSFFIENNKINFEATPEYLYYDFVPERVYKYNKNMKFIVLFREPSSRCYSAWNMFKSFNKNNPQDVYDIFTQYANPEIREKIKKLLFVKEFPTFKESVREEIEYGLDNVSTNREPSFVRRGLYVLQVREYLKYFKKENMLFLEQRELAYPEKVVEQIADFLNIGCTPKITRHASNVGNYEEISKEDRDILEELKTIYRPYNEALFELIGKRYDWNDK